MGLAGALAGLCIGGAPAFGTLGIHSVQQSAQQVGLYEPFSVRFGLTRAYDNPYDPDQIDITFEFTGPSGIPRVIPAFWIEQTPGWMARIVPLELGPHNGRIRAEDATQEVATYDLTFTVVASGARGSVRIDDRNPRYLRFDHGEPYLPVGHNLCWYGGDPIFNTWLYNMYQAGENWTRYWMVAYVQQDIEWGYGTDGQLGTYSQTNSAMFDNMLEQARSYGIQVQLCLDSFNGWNHDVYPNWNENPYNVANGGMLTDPVDYFTDATARNYARRRFRYIVARWAYNPAVLCWELWNEVDAVGSGGDSFWGHVPEAVNWHREMAQYIRSIDPFAHLITTSFADDGPASTYRQFWQLPEMSLVQVHQYSSALPSSHVAMIRDRQQHGKPVILGEGNDAGVPALSKGGASPALAVRDTGALDYTDDDGQTLHDLIWAAAVVESGAMSWWWDNWIHPNQLYSVFTPLVTFLQGEDWAPQALAPASVTILSGHSLEIYGSAGPLHAYLFLREIDPGVVSGLRIRLNQLGAQTFAVEYWDTYSGVVFSAQTRTGTAAGLVLDVPSFTRDMAIKVGVQGPVILVEPAELNATAVTGTDAPPGSFSVRNIGSGTLAYAISDDADWLEVVPTSGDSTGEIDDIAVIYDTDTLGIGPYAATITVTDQAALNSPQTISVTLIVTAHPLDFDGDEDVDQSDFGHLQECLSGRGVAQDDPHCVDARVDDDEDVDQDDVALFVACASGAGVRADPGCPE